MSSIYLTGSHVDPNVLAAQMPELELDWRALACTKLQQHGLQVVNPLELTWSSRSLEDAHERRIRRALELIDQSDALLANLHTPSWGTAMEIFYGHRRGKVVTVVGNSPFSPWVVSHSQARFVDLEQALEYLIGESLQFEPLRWSLQYEAQLAQHYEEFPLDGEPDYHFLGGDIPVLVIAPHATGYFREGEFQEPDMFTGALASLLNRVSACHSMISQYCLAADPCIYLQTPMKRALVDIVRAGEIGLILMLLGSSGNETPGIKVSDNGPENSISEEFACFARLSLACLEPVAEEVGKPLPLASFCADELGIPTITLKLHRRYRMPKLQPEPFVKTADLLNELIQKAGCELLRGER